MAEQGARFVGKISQRKKRVRETDCVRAAGSAHSDPYC